MRIKSLFPALLIYLLSYSLFAQNISSKEEEITYADPTIFVENNTYYMTGTRGGTPLGFELLESKDLKRWKHLSSNSSMILVKDSSTFGNNGFWAPQLLKENGRYYLTYTANEQTCLAQSTSLLSLFKQNKIEPIDATAKNIDSYLFKDKDGKYYFYHVRFNNGNFLWVAEFDITKGHIKPETLKQCLDNTESWEATPNFKSGPIMEGPTVILLDSTYYLFYSANHFENIDYAVGYATAPTPCGPWTKHKNNPIIHRSLVGENGSGHGDIFKVNGQLYYIYHVHYSGTKVSPRKTRIIPLKMKKDKQTGIYSITANYKEIIKPVLIQ